MSLSDVSTRLSACIRVGLVIWAIASTTVPVSTIHAQETDIPVSFTADEMDVDRALGIITARGNVEVRHEGRTLIADTVSYNQNLDVVTASGNVILNEPNGDVLFTDYMELDSDLKNGVVSNIRIILSDGSRVAANSAERLNEDMRMSKAVYSPCNLCENDPEKPPLWQVKAITVFHDSSRRVVEYSDAWLEVAGVPVFYTPFLTHPDPTVKRESGFLPPTVGNSTSLGAMLKTPYYWNISEHADTTITPAMYSDQGPGLETEYRQRLRNGEFEIENSIVNDDDVGTRAHIDAFARFNIDETWRWGADVDRTTDDTYQRRYGFGNERTLTSNLYAEGFRKQNYIRSEAILFQGLRQQDDNDETPIVTPLIEFDHVGQPNIFGGQTTLNASTAFLSRKEGADSYRLSLSPGWQATYVSDAGEQIRIVTALDADGYMVDDFTPQGSSTEFSGRETRIFPHARLDWRFPFAKQSGSVQQVIEPIASVRVAPNGGNPETIPNQDSQEFEFDETSLFRSSRFTGRDRVEGGTRIDYGTQWGVYGAEGGFTTVFVGQSYRLRQDSTFAEGTGLEDKLSDFVAKMQVSPGSYVNLLYRTRLGKDNLSVRRNEMELSLGGPLLKLNTQYRMFNAQEKSEFGDREDIDVSMTSQLSETWSLFAEGNRDIDEEETRRLKFGAVYEDECFIFTTQVTRSFFHDRDLKPEDAVIFRLSFKTLGDAEFVR